jgi:hypothetical protein
VYVLYRTAKAEIHRDTYLLESRNRGTSFQGKLLDPWQIPGCPMSSMTLLATPRGVVAAWQTEGQVYWGNKIAAPGDAKGRKHAVLARNGRGETILVWTEGTGWKKGGNLAWQVFDREGVPAAEKGSLPGVPVWSYAAAWARADGGFSIVY